MTTPPADEVPKKEDNDDYPAATLKHIRDFLKEHDPEVFDALFYKRDDLGKEEE